MADTAMNIMTRNDMRKTVVKITFIPKLSKFPPVRPRRFEFATTVMATDFITTIKPPPGAQLGSPKQFKAKIARMLHLPDPSYISKYDLHAEFEVTGEAHAGVDTGVIDQTDLDTFVEGAATDLPETNLPVSDVEAILNEVDENPTPGIEFPE